MDDIQSIFDYIASNYGWISLIMVALTSAIVELLKIPYKKLTAKIKNERIRKLANKFIIILGFGISFGLRYLGSIWLSKYISFDANLAFVEGAFSNVLYAIGEGIITSDKAKSIATDITTAASDGIVSTSEASDIVSKITDTGEDTETAAKAKKEFDEIISKTK